MNIWVKPAALLLVPLLVVGAAASDTEGQNKKQERTSIAQANLASGPKVQVATDDPDYMIGAQDILDITVWKEPEISRTVPVRPDGKISLPLLNDVQAAGLTPMQLGALITEDLKKYVAGPQVTVIVTAINSKRIYIVGGVGRPGAFPLLPNMTVLQALSSAGGIGQFANGKKIYVLRTEKGRQLKIPFNYKEALAGLRPEQNIELRPGDTIVVP
jgi:polysaccharide export outer membrane protein